ncbi:hypothetical protein [Pseudofrankia inefficax]|uniref:Uncharacterized protein n=1 Tax=Pseudofrankia inefficax (strain DSM 45817 / CECT 9037 / DDB 130130 / EuI1c) TaxID=298654 RepID=E3JCQ3_PSEI1|nr:hypothetical protein [Pseudofrankia inefficax]ADP79893.1 hypothetical protein FraEuI1c_1837 [Pseudofrankia inefficax]
MEQRSAGERQRVGGLNRRGNAVGGDSPASRTDPGGRFGTEGVRAMGARTGPHSVPLAMRSDSGSDPAPGRHRSPWGRSGRILPIRWGRIVVGCLVALGVVVGILGFALVSRGGNGGRADTASSGSTGRQPGASNPVAVVAPSPAQAGAPSGETSGVASPAPGVQEVLPGQLSSAPPAPTSPPSAAVKVTQPGPRPAGPVLTLGRTSVDLGSVDSTDSVDLTATGTTAVDLRIGGGLPSWLTAVPRTTHLDPGFRTELVITLDRSAAPVGQISVPINVTVATGTGGGTIQVTGAVTAGPKILSVTPPSLRPQACATDQAPATGPLTVQVQDAIGMAGGTVTVTTADGTTTLSLQLATSTDDQSTWTASLGPAPAGTLGYTITVKDLNSRTASQQGSFTVAAC